MLLSIVIPIYNERDNVIPLYRQIVDAFANDRRLLEILFVDDGSQDGTSERLDQLAEYDRRVKIVRFRRNFGQTAAMQAGLQHAAGDAIAMMDGDLQNDPADIPAMVDRLDDGYDLVHGWRKNRQDRWINRRLPSMIANWLISRTTGFPVHDLGCTLKVIRREIAQELELYGEMHRFIPILAHQHGARCVEVVTRHHPRRFGKTKYGISRTIRVILDLLTVKFMLDYFTSPMKLFGGIGLAASLLGALGVLVAVGLKFGAGTDVTGNPLLLISVFSAMIGLQFFSLGLLGEVNARIYFRNRPRQNYTVRECINFDSAAEQTLRVRAA